MKKINFKNSSFVIFLIISIFYAITNFIWWYLNTPIIPIRISAFHFSDIFRDGYLYYNAPLITWIIKGIFFLFGKEYFDLQIIIVNYIFFFIILYFIYKIGVELKDKETGNITMVLFALTPTIYGLLRQYGHQDWHVMIAMIVNIYCLIKLNYFKNRKWSILYGISVGLGLLIKDAFLAYFFTPWVYVLVRSLVERIEGNKIINILITILMGSLIAGCHYFRIQIINKIVMEPITEPVSVFAFSSLRTMTIGLWEELLSPPIFLLFIFGFFWFVINYKNKNKWIMILWFIVPWSIIMFMPHHKEVEYGAGFVPAIIVFVSLWLSSFRKILIKKAILIFCIIICLLQFFDFSFCDNTNLFSFKVNYKDNDISYYNKYYFEDAPFMSYKKSKYVIPFVNYYINNFNNKTFFIHHLYDKFQHENFDCWSIKLYLYTKNINCYEFKNDVDNADIVLCTEAFDIRNRNFVFNIEEECEKENYERNKKHLFDVEYGVFDGNKIFEEVSLFSDKINNEYIMLDDFYLDENDKRLKTHVYLLGKKELFEGKSNIKYPYKMMN